MTALWWLVSLALVVSSALLLVAGIQGKEGEWRIGAARRSDREDASGQESEPPQEPPGPPEAGGLPGAAPEKRRINLPNVAIGAIGLAVGLAALVLFAI